MPLKPPSPARFRSSYDRQRALWVLRLALRGAGRIGFFVSRDDPRRSGKLTSCYAAPEFARFLGLPRYEGYQATTEVREMMKRLLLALEEDARPIGLPQRVQRNIDALGDCFDLDETERAIFGYFVCRRADSSLESAYSNIASDVVFTESAESVAQILRLPRATAAKALGPRQPLLRFGLIEEADRNGSRCFRIANEDLADHLFHESFDPERVLKSFRVQPTVPPAIDLRDFPHLGEALECLLGYLREVVGEGRRGVNVLFHGVPGGGKTELSRIVGRDLGLPVYEVEAKAEQRSWSEFGGRLLSLKHADAALSGAPALLVFDALEDVLDSSSPWRFTVDANKAWFKETLELNQVPTIWIADRIAGLDPAFAGRFDLILEVPVPPREERRRLVASTVGDLVGDELAERIAESSVLAPAVLKRVARVVAAAFGADPVERREAALARLLGETLKAQGHADPFRDATPVPSAPPPKPQHEHRL